jgi:hypothetical protein
VDLNHKDIKHLLDSLIAKLEERRIVAIIQVFGGSAIIFHHQNRQPTSDIDSYLYPPTAILEIAKEIAGDIPELQDSWINNSISAVLPPIEDKKSILYYKGDYVTVTLASEEYLLAMKAMTERQLYRDKLDGAIVFNSLSLKCIDDIADIVKEYYLDTGNQLSQRPFWTEIVALANTLPKTKSEPQPQPIQKLNFNMEEYLQDVWREREDYNDQGKTNRSSGWES